MSNSREVLHNPFPRVIHHLILGSIPGGYVHSMRSVYFELESMPLTAQITHVVISWCYVELCNVRPLLSLHDLWPTRELAWARVIIVQLRELTLAKPVIHASSGLPGSVWVLRLAVVQPLVKCTCTDSRGSTHGCFILQLLCAQRQCACGEVRVL